MGIGRRALKSTIFVGINSYASFGLGTVSSIIMARLLLPEHFGIVALANFFLSLFGRVKEFGLDYALIHRQDQLERAFKTHFTLQVGLSILNLVLVVIAVPFLRQYYSTEVIAILIVLAFFTVFKAAGTTSRIYLEKELRFGKTTLVDLIALVISAILGIVSAFLGAGVWSLVILNVSGIMITFLGLAFAAKWQLRFSMDKEMVLWFLRFGFFLWIGGLTTFVIFQYNDFVIGTFISAAVLGFYTKAYQFAQLPTTLVTGIVSRVALPTYSKLQGDSEKLSIAFNLVLRNIFRLSAPFSLILFLIAEDFTRLLLGERWLPMVPLLQLLLIFSLLRPIFDDTGAFLTAIGKPQILSKYLTIQALLLLVLTPVLVWVYRENGAAVSLNIVMIIGVAIAYYYARKFVAINFREIFLPTLLAVILTAIVYFIFQNVVATQKLNLIFRLTLNLSLICFAYGTFVWWLERDSLKSDLRLFKGIIKNDGS